MITKTKNNYGRFICDAKDIAFFSAYLYKYLEEIYSMSHFEWPVVKEKYRPILNELKSIMVRNCPKPAGYKQPKKKN